MAITITNTGADTFISDGSQVPTWNKNFIAGLTKATAIDNPLTAGLDSVMVLDNTGRSIIMAYSDITDINGSTPAALGLLDAAQVASYLNNNFFDFGNGSTVTTVAPLSGDGTIGLPIKIIDGTNTGDILIWDGSGWAVKPAPSWNLDARRSVKTYSFGGGFTLSGGGSNGNNLVGTPFFRNSSNASMLSPGEVNREPIIQLVNAAGVWIKLYTSNTAGCYFPISQAVTKKYYLRSRLKISSIAAGASARVGFIQAPATTVQGGVGFEINPGAIRAFSNTGASYSYGANVGFVAGTWFDVEMESQYIGGALVTRVYVNGVLVSTASRVDAAFSYNTQVMVANCGSANTLIIHTDLLEYSIYG